MVITMSKNKCTLTDSKSFEEYELKTGPENNLKAHWDYRSQGKSKRYYIGTLLVQHDYNEIEWAEMRKNRKTDKWIRVGAHKLNDMTPRQWLEHIRKKRRRSSQSKYITTKTMSSKTKLVRKRGPTNYNEQNQRRHHQSPQHPQYGYGPSSNSQRYPRNVGGGSGGGGGGGGYGSNDPSGNSHYYDSYDSYDQSAQYDNYDSKRDRNGKSRTKYVLKPSGNNQSQSRQHPRHQRQEPQHTHTMQYQDPAIMGMSRGKSKKKYQTEHKPLKRDQKYYVEYHPKLRLNVPSCFSV